MLLKWFLYFIVTYKVCIFKSIMFFREPYRVNTPAKLSIEFINL